MPQRLTLKSATVRSVSVPLRRPVVSKVGLFREWPLILIDLYTNEGVVGRGYLEPYLKQSPRYIIPVIEDLVGVTDRHAAGAPRQLSGQPALAQPRGLRRHNDDRGCRY